MSTWLFGSAANSSTISSCFKLGRSGPLAIEIGKLWGMFRLVLGRRIDIPVLVCSVVSRGPSKTIHIKYSTIVFKSLLGKIKNLSVSMCIPATSNSSTSNSSTSDTMTCSDENIGYCEAKPSISKTKSSPAPVRWICCSLGESPG